MADVALRAKESNFGLPQGLKPVFFASLDGTAQAVPFPKTIFFFRRIYFPRDVCLEIYFSRNLFIREIFASEKLFLNDLQRRYRERQRQ
jgi:hypothetical protein